MKKTSIYFLFVCNLLYECQTWDEWRSEDDNESFEMKWLRKMMNIKLMDRNTNVEVFDRIREIVEKSEEENGVLDETWETTERYFE